MADIAKLIDMLHSPKAGTRFEACELLRVAPAITPEGITALESALRDPDPSVVESAKGALAVHQVVRRGQAPSAPTELSAPNIEAERAGNVYRWLWLSPFLTIPTMAFLLFSEYGHDLVCGEVAWQQCDYHRAFFVSSLIAVLGSALWHLVLLIPALDRRSQFVRWHGRQALLLAAIRTSVPLAAAFYDSSRGGGGALLLLSIPVLIILWLAGSLWGQGQARRGDCSLMRWTGHGAGLPLPVAAPAAPAAPGQGPRIAEQDPQAAYDLSLKLHEQGKREEAAHVLQLLLVANAPDDLKSRAAERLRHVGDVNQQMTADVLVAILRFGRDEQQRQKALVELQRLGLVEAL